MKRGIKRVIGANLSEPQGVMMSTALACVRVCLCACVRACVPAYVSARPV